MQQVLGEPDHGSGIRAKSSRPAPDVTGETGVGTAQVERKGFCVKLPKDLGSRV